MTSEIPDFLPEGMGEMALGKIVPVDNEERALFEKHIKDQRAYQQKCMELDLQMFEARKNEILERTRLLKTIRKKLEKESWGWLKKLLG